MSLFNPLSIAIVHITWNRSVITGFCTFFHGFNSAVNNWKVMSYYEWAISECQSLIKRGFYNIAKISFFRYHFVKTCMKWKTWPLYVTTNVGFRECFVCLFIFMFNVLFVCTLYCFIFVRSKELQCFTRNMPKNISWSFYVFAQT